jgi:hypothetical protein
MHRRTALIAGAALLIPTTLHAEPQGGVEMGGVVLSPAQIALFETPHLAALTSPVRLEYSFLREEEGKEPVADRIRLDVRPSAEEAGRHDVVPEFLTGARQLRYPPARGFRGNPLLLFALDRDARELAAATGGAMQWFRQRIRRAFAESAELRQTEVELGGSLLPATKIDITPFTGEPRAARYQQRRYAFLLADAVPGVIHSITTDTPAGVGGGAMREHIAFRSAEPLPAEGTP